MSSEPATGADGTDRAQRHCSSAPAEFRGTLRGVLHDVARERDRSSSDISRLLDVRLLDPEQARTASTVVAWALLAEDDPVAREAHLGALAALSARGHVTAPLLKRVTSWLSERDLDADDAELLADLEENLSLLPASATRPSVEQQAAGRPLGPIRLRELVRGLLSEVPAERVRSALTVEVCQVHGGEIDADEATVIATVACWAIPVPDLQSTRSPFLHLLASLSADRPVPPRLLQRLVSQLDPDRLAATERSAFDGLVEQLDR